MPVGVAVTIRHCTVHALENRTVVTTSTKLCIVTAKDKACVTTFKKEGCGGLAFVRIAHRRQ